MMKENQLTLFTACGLAGLCGLLLVVRWAGGLADMPALSADAAELLSVLLLIPPAALLTAAARNVLGLVGFGVFAPALLAAALRMGDLPTGLAAMAAVLGAAMAVRTAVERLGLMLAPRLGLVLTGSAVATAILLILAPRLGLAGEAGDIALAAVAAAILAERFCACRDDEGPGLAWRLLVATAVLAGACLALMHWNALGDLLVRLPELTLLWAVGLLLLGRYAGYRLSELVRFRAIARQDRKQDD